MVDTVSGSGGDLPLPKSYLAPFIEGDLPINGRIDDPRWSQAPWTDDFVDILGEAGPRPRFRTRMKMAWNETYLYVAAELEEPHVWGTLTEHDSIIFQDNDFEVFLDPDGDGHLYGELEVNALNTTWDLLLVRPYRAGGPAIDGWEIHGLQTAVHINGTLNDPSDEDHSWTVEIAMPWRSISELSRERRAPKRGEIWRMNFSRVQWQHEIVDGQYRKIPGLPEDNWVWTPQGAVDMHRPERWGFVQFGFAGDDLATERDPEPDQLFALLAAQREFRKATGRWATSAGEFGQTREGLQIETTTTLLEMTLGGWKIDGSGRLWRA